MNRYIHAHAHTHTYTYTYTHIYIYIYIYIYICPHLQKDHPLEERLAESRLCGALAHDHRTKLRRKGTAGENDSNVSVHVLGVRGREG